MDRLPDLDDLRVFEALFTEGSVTRAARRLGLTQSGVSGVLARLRGRFDDPLFVRAGAGVRPTPRAETLRGPAREALEAARRLAEAARPFDPAKARARFTLAATDYIALVLAPELAARLASQAPGIDLQVIAYDKDEAGALLAKGIADLVIGVFPDPPERCVATPLFEERFIGVARAGHPLIEAGRISLEAYAGAAHALITLRRDGSGALDAALAARGLARRVALTLPYAAALGPVLRRSDLLAAAPSCLMGEAALSGLQTFALPIETAPWTLSALWQPETRSDPGLAWFRDQTRAAGQAVAARRRSSSRD